VQFLTLGCCLGPIQKLTVPDF